MSKYSVWTTKDGTKILVKQLEDSHLLNILRLLIKAAVVERVKTERCYLYPPFGGPTGEAAQDCFDREFDQVLEATTEDYLSPFWETLSSEAQRRGLKVPDLPDEALVGVLAIRK